MEKGVLYQQIWSARTYFEYELQDISTIKFRDYFRWGEKSQNSFCAFCQAGFPFERRTKAQLFLHSNHTTSGTKLEFQAKSITLFSPTQTFLSIRKREPEGKR